MRLPSDATLIVVDVEPPRGGEPGPPTTPMACIGHLVAVWRSAELSIVHARPEADGVPGPSESGEDGRETFVARLGASAFSGTDLDERLTARGCTTLVVCGFDTDLAVEATVRHAADLGFRVFVVGDSCAARARTDLAGRPWTAEDLHILALTRMTLAGASVVDLRTAWIAAKTAGWGRK